MFLITSFSSRIPVSGIIDFTLHGKPHCENGCTIYIVVSSVPNGLMPFNAPPCLPLPIVLFLSIMTLFYLHFLINSPPSFLGQMRANKIILFWWIIDSSLLSSLTCFSMQPFSFFCLFHQRCTPLVCIPCWLQLNIKKRHEMSDEMVCLSLFVANCFLLLLPTQEECYGLKDEGWGLAVLFLFVLFFFHGSTIQYYNALLCPTE